MSRIKTIRLIPRLILAGIAGLIIFAIGFNAAWKSTKGQAATTQRQARRYLNMVNSAIQAYHKEHGKWPASLKKIYDDTNFPSSDIWGHPYAYHLTENSYTLISYGRDGKPGGVGLDSDISVNNPHTVNNDIPFRHLITIPWAINAIKGCALAGFLTFLLIFFLVRPEDFNLDGLGCILVKLVPTLFVLFYLTILMIALEYPSGH